MSGMYGFVVQQSISDPVAILKRLFPQLLDVPSAKNLMPLSASPARVWMTQKHWAARRRMARRFGLPERVRDCALVVGKPLSEV